MWDGNYGAMTKRRYSHYEMMASQTEAFAHVLARLSDIQRCVNRLEGDIKDLRIRMSLLWHSLESTRREDMEYRDDDL